MNDSLKLKDVGTVISDEVSPSFDTFKFEAYAEEFLSPGALVGTMPADKKFLIGRVTAGLELEPEPGSPEPAGVRRVYEVDVMEEGLVGTGGDDDKVTMIEPSDMAATGADGLYRAKPLWPTRWGLQPIPSGRSSWVEQGLRRKTP